MTLLAAAAALAGLAGSALGQEAAPDATPPPAPEISPAAPTALFPEGTSANPPTAAARTGRRGGNRRAKGGRRNSQYSSDVAVSQANADPLEVRIAFRKAKTRAMLDPTFSDLLLQSENAATDDQKRAILRTYYTRLYAAVLRIDKSPAMKAHVGLLAKTSEQRYDPKRRAFSDDDDLNSGGRGRNRR